jgi:hypothetical protein
MKIYNYDKDTGEYIGESIARIDPKETYIRKKKTYAIPANATEKKPPKVGTNEVAVFESGVWKTEIDFRGEWYLPSGKKITIKAIGEALPAGASDKPPAPKLSELKEEKKAAVKTEAGMRIDLIIPAGHKQKNSLARGFELLRKEQKKDIKPAETTELNQLESKWLRIKAIRSASNNIEAEIDGFTKKKAVEDYDINKTGNWPE